ncbi:hypothetical protein BK010_04130 [Tenericutes bacterium MO-XQ]|nr:hypothetical protein BK010_04130 [Tenericutes bacterium MO-XQ]
MMKIGRYRFWMSLTSFILIFLTSLIALYAYFQIQEDHGIIISSGEFDVEILASFDGVIVNLESEYYDHDKQKLIVNMFDENADNYVGKLKIDIKVEPVIAARLRVKIKQETELIRYYIDQNPENPIPPLKEAVYHSDQGYPYYPFSPLRFDPTFTIKQNDDGFMYYDQIIPKSSETIIPVIEYGDPYTIRVNSVLYEECYMYIDIDLDIVQANRFSEVWGISDTFYID